MKRLFALDYPVPDPCQSAEQARKLAHEDLPNLSDYELWREKHRLEDVLAWSDDPHPWLRERYQAVCAEQGQRCEEGQP